MSTIIATKSVARVFLGAMVILAALSGRAGAEAKTGPETVACPEKIAVAEIAVTPDAWRSEPVKVEHALKGVLITEGKPGERLVEIAPDERKESGSQVVQSWSLKANRTGPFQLTCRYRGTIAVLTMDLPPKLSSCTLTTHRSGNETKVVAALSCR